MAKAPEFHKDLIGNNICVGDVIAFADKNALYVGKIEKLHNKMCTVSRKGKWSKLAYPENCVLLNSPMATMYLLQN